jgi:Ca2+-binding EF-hand superfamily protein
MINDHLSQWKVTQLATAFSEMDRDKDGVVPAHEFGALLRSVGRYVTDQRVAEIINYSDPQRTGRYDLLTFLKVIRHEIFDVDREIKIQKYVSMSTDIKKATTLDDIRRALVQNNPAYTEQDAVNLFTYADKNKDGIVTFEEMEGSIQ